MTNLKTFIRKCQSFFKNDTEHIEIRKKNRGNGAGLYKALQFKSTIKLHVICRTYDNMTLLNSSVLSMDKVLLTLDREDVEYLYTKYHIKYLEEVEREELEKANKLKEELDREFDEIASYVH